MFENLSNKLDRAFKVLKGQGSITEVNVASTIKEIRRALIEADVSYKVAKEITLNIKAPATPHKIICLRCFGAKFAAIKPMIIALSAVKIIVMKII